MSTEVGMKSWFTATLDTVHATLVEHRTTLQQLLTAMQQESYADELQLPAVMEVQVILDEAFAALGDAYSRLTAAGDLVDTVPRLVPPVGGSRLAAPHIVSAIGLVETVQETVKRINVRVRVIAVLFASKTTRAGLVAGEVANARDLLAGIFAHWEWLLTAVANARAEFN